MLWGIGDGYQCYRATCFLCLHGISEESWDVDGFKGKVMGLSQQKKKKKTGQ
jgi:hypothetical protein